jgi:hypothetical protein
VICIERLVALAIVLSYEILVTLGGCGHLDSFQAVEDR